MIRKLSNNNLRVANGGMDTHSSNNTSVPTSSPIFCGRIIPTKIELDRCLIKQDAQYIPPAPLPIPQTSFSNQQAPDYISRKPSPIPQMLYRSQQTPCPISQMPIPK